MRWLVSPGLQATWTVWQCLLDPSCTAANVEVRQHACLNFHSDLWNCLSFKQQVNQRQTPKNLSACHSPTRCCRTWYLRSEFCAFICCEVRALPLSCLVIGRSQFRTHTHHAQIQTLIQHLHALWGTFHGRCSRLGASKKVVSPLPWSLPERPLILTSINPYNSCRPTKAAPFSNIGISEDRGDGGVWGLIESARFHNWKNNLQ